MTHEIIKNCDLILQELMKFSPRALFLGEPALDKDLQELESLLKITLPLDFKYLLSKHNSFSLVGTEVYGYGSQFKEASLDKIYIFEHEEVQNPMFPELFPFFPDGGGNHYCLDLSKLKDQLCPVVFWQHDYEYRDKDDVEVCYNNFTGWVDEVMIEWTLEDTNYDGSDKL